MRIAILAGAVALAAPVVADAAVFDISYTGTADFQSLPFEDRDDDLGEYEAAFAEASAQSFAFDFAATVTVPEGISSFRSGYGFYGRDSFEQSRDLIQVEVFNLQGPPSYSIPAGADLLGLEPGLSDVALSFDVQETGGISNLVLSFQDQSDEYYVATGEGFRVLDNEAYGATYEGPGSFSVSRLDTPEVAPVPLPATAPLIAMGLAALGWARRRRS